MFTLLRLICLQKSDRNSIGITSHLKVRADASLPEKTAVTRRSPTEKEVMAIVGAVASTWNSCVVCSAYPAASANQVMHFRADYHQHVSRSVWHGTSMVQLRLHD